MANNYTLGRGEIHFARFATGTQTPGGERYLGNTPELGFSAEQETLDHYNSDRGVRNKDESVILQIDYSGSFVTDDIDMDNLALFFLGDHVTTTEAGGPVTAEAITGAEQGLSYQLGTSDSFPAGVKGVSAVAVKGTGGTPTYVVDTDYTVDLDLARITIVEGGGIPDGTDLEVDYTVDAKNRERVISKSHTIEGALRYIAYNPAGKNFDYFMPWAKLTPNGEFNLKGDEWQQLGFNLEVLKKGTYENVYIDGRPFTP